MSDYRQVFISYKAEEFDDANWVRATLENNGISCWMAPMSIPGGSSYASEIEQAIQNCKVFVLILSDKSQNSKWVAKELDRALNANKVIMPFALDNCALKDDFNFYLTNVQRYDAYINKVNAMQTMIRDIKAIIGSSSASPVPPAPPAPPVPPAPPAGNKKKLFIGIAIAAAVLVLILIIALVFGGSDDKGASSGENSGSSYANTEYQDENVTMSDELSDFTFELEGVVYQLPCSYNKFVENGWTISESGISDETKIGGNEYDYFKMSRNGKSIYAHVYNLSGNAKAIKDCPIGGIDANVYNGASITIAKNITPSSSVDEIIAAFGSPHEQNNYTDYQTLEYIMSDTNYNYVKFTCYHEDQRLSSIELINYVADGSEKTETNEKKPEYLSSYKAPSSLGNGLSEATIMVENKVYRMPAPLSEFTDDGWVITQQPNSVAAGNTDSIRVEKDGAVIYLGIANLSDYQTIPANCAVYRVNIDSANGDISATLPGALSIGSSRSETESFTADGFTSYDGTYSTSYYFYQSEPRYVNIDISVSNETNTVSRISVSCSEWDYE